MFGAREKTAPLGVFGSLVSLRYEALQRLFAIIGCEIHGSVEGSASRVGDGRG